MEKRYFRKLKVQSKQLYAFGVRGVGLKFNRANDTTATSIGTTTGVVVR